MQLLLLKHQDGLRGRLNGGLLELYFKELVDPLSQMAQRHAKSMFAMKKISMV